MVPEVVCGTSGWRRNVVFGSVGTGVPELVGKTKTN